MKKLDSETKIKKKTTSKEEATCFSPHGMILDLMIFFFLFFFLLFACTLFKSKNWLADRFIF